MQSISRCQFLTRLSRHIQPIFEYRSTSQSTASTNNLPPLLFPTRSYHHNSDHHTDNSALEVQNLLKLQINRPEEEIYHSLNQCNLILTEDLVLAILKRHRSDWRPAYTFFNWVTAAAAKTPSGYSPGRGVYNEILDILGRMKRFDEVRQVLDEMSNRKDLINERMYGIVVNRFAAAHMVEEAIEFFYKRKELGLELDLIAFQTLLLSLCRYKHAEAAEFLFHNKKGLFKDDIKTRNIILNGWCVMGSLREAKRFWNDIVTSKCRPDKFTYGIFINSLCKAGKISTAVRLFRAMWEKGCNPDVAICNSIIDGLCFKKRIPQALEIFKEMNDNECLPDVATYNSLIKHLCKIRRMEKVYELLDEMEDRGEGCMPDARTYGYLLKYAKTEEEVSQILGRMDRSGCKMLADTYNLLLRLFMDWGNEGKVKDIWDDMERNGLGPDQRSYTIMVHGLYDEERLEDSFFYYNQMISKGMVPEPRTKLLVDAMNIKLKNRDAATAKNHSNTQKVSHKKGQEKRRKR